MPALATFEDVQSGYEKPIPASLKPKVEKFLDRASLRLHFMVPKLDAALAKAYAESDYDPSAPAGDDNEMPRVPAFVRDMVVQAAENKLRNFGGFSSESAGVFSVTREDYWAKGRISFDPEDLTLLRGEIDEAFGAYRMGPIRSHVPCTRLP
ncbi:head-to-tail adaptor [Gordonia phage Outis]|nr:head-to-tail adaptor [Gordonia phage StarStruck]WGH22039.1 head-to-tail adaptor [Gordonia phage MerCougar]WKW85005.1 head-to-tail adaptor [Gordonia phage Outis]